MKAFILTILLAFVLPSLASASCGYERKVELLAKVMYHEARGEEPDGMLAVGEVVLNRVASKNYPSTICGVILAPDQFSPKIKNGVPKGETWNEAKSLAREILTGQTDVLGHGATHFLNPKGVRKMPKWTREFERVGRVGNHVFYAERTS